MDERFRHHWERWHALIAEGMSPAELLASAADETLVELLAYAGEGSAFERNIIATELTNRITRLHRSVGEHVDRIEALVGRNEAALAEAARADEEMRQQGASFREGAGKTSRYGGGRKGDGGW